MENITFSNSNVKGQVVLPSSMRKKLGITSSVPLAIELKSDSIIIRPVQGVLTSNVNEKSYIEILKKTKGTWKVKDNRKSKRKKELKASKKRREAW
jgi:AbrB family looped-hinge helix DNA binding protein